MLVYSCATFHERYTLIHWHNQLFTVFHSSHIISQSVGLPVWMPIFFFLYFAEYYSNGALFSLTQQLVIEMKPKIWIWCSAALCVCTHSRTCILFMNTGRKERNSLRKYVFPMLLQFLMWCACVHVVICTMISFRPSTSFDLAHQSLAHKAIEINCMRSIGKHRPLPPTPLLLPDRNVMIWYSFNTQWVLY